jgi:hypothetical protein
MWKDSINVGLKTEVMVLRTHEGMSDLLGILSGSESSLTRDVIIT